MTSKVQEWGMKAPGWAKDLAVMYGATRLYLSRRGSRYRQMIALRRNLRARSYQDLLAYQQMKLNEVLDRAQRKSPFYADRLRGIDAKSLSRAPVLEKEDLRQNIESIVIGDIKKLNPIYSGGTTGKSIVTYASNDSMGDRISLLDLYWEDHGYRFRDKFAWFSGRNLIGENDEEARVFWRMNRALNIRYYSTFHLSEKYLRYYIGDLNRYQPKFFQGFPSALYELARFMEAEGLSFEFQPKALFTTSESVSPAQRETIETAFNCKIREHYGAAEGPPMIFECPQGRLHLDVTSGFLELVDDDLRPAREGDALVTSFYMYETPIIRYRIGDRMRLAEEHGCPCGWDTPVVEEIIGRSLDYLDIPGRGRIFAAQFGDCVKYVTTMSRFQVELVDGALLRARVIADRERFEKGDRRSFEAHLRERIGDIPIEIEYVDDIPRTVSGKHTVIRKTQG